MGSRERECLAAWKTRGCFKDKGNSELDLEKWRSWLDGGTTFLVREGFSIWVLLWAR